MRLLQYLPSSQFSSTVGAIALAALLIVGAQYYTARPATTPSLAANTPGYAPGSEDWQATLRDIQTKAAIAAPQTPDEGDVSALLSAAESSNVTDSVARTLFINLSSAKAQGLGDDLPTQDKLIAEAAARLQKDRVVAYTATDLVTVAQTKDSLRAYGNGVMTVLSAHPKARVYETYLALGEAIDHNDPAKLAPLKTIGEAYAAIAEDLSQLPVPKTLSPLQVRILNSFAAVADTYTDLRAIHTDPLRGLAGLQNHELYLNETSRLFTNVAQELSKNGILFNKDEPGYAWGAYLPSTP